MGSVAAGIKLAPTKQGNVTGGNLRQILFLGFKFVIVFISLKIKDTVRQTSKSELLGAGSLTHASEARLS